jgi:hypothetical protein
MFLCPSFCVHGSFKFFSSETQYKHQTTKPSKSAFTNINNRNTVAVQTSESTVKCKVVPVPNESHAIKKHSGADVYFGFGWRQVVSFITQPF